MKLSDLIKRVDELLVDAEAVAKTEHMGITPFDRTLDFSWKTCKATVLSFLLNTYGNNHPYYELVKEQTGSPSSIKIVSGVLSSIRHEMNGGWLIKTRSLVTADIFTDFMEMAEYLLTEGYKDASAVIIGSVLGIKFTRTL